MANSIGIDFGTTTTMVSYLDSATGRPELVTFGHSRFIPTTVHIDDSGQWLFGAYADEQIALDPEGYCRAFKLHLGEKEPVLPRTDETAESLTARFLRYVKKECEQTVFRGKKIAEATVTVPVAFAPARLAALKRAAESAGFAKVDFLPEPESAGIAFLRDNPGDKFSRALVLDWGGGTLDTAIISRKDDGTIHADRRCAKGNDEVGGEEMDRLLLEYVEGKWENAFGKRLVNDEFEEIRFKRWSQQVKETLSQKNTVPFRYGPKKIDISRKDFRRIVGQLLDNAVDLVRSSLSQNKARGNPEPDAILLIGGTSQSPVVREAMAEEFPKLRILSWHHSHEAVALGALPCKTDLPVGTRPTTNKQMMAATTRSVSFAPPETSGHEKRFNAAFAAAEKLSDEKDSLRALSKGTATVISEAAKLGNPRGMALFGEILRDGCKGFPKKPNECREWWKKSAEAGDPRGQADLALLLAGGFADLFAKRDLETAKQLAETAAETDPSINNLSVLIFVLASLSDPDWKQIERIGEALVSQQNGKGKTKTLSNSDAGWMGTVFYHLSLAAEVRGDECRRLAMLRRGEEFGCTACSSELNDLPDQTDAALRLFSKLASVDGRKNPDERAFMNRLWPGCTDPFYPDWSRPFGPNETIRHLAEKTVLSYDRDEERLGQLFLFLHALAACDGKPVSSEKTALSIIEERFNNPDDVLEEEDQEEEEEVEVEEAEEEEAEEVEEEEEEIEETEEEDQEVEGEEQNEVEIPVRVKPKNRSLAPATKTICGPPLSPLDIAVGVAVEAGKDIYRFGKKWLQSLF